jgi:butyryl-CoA dehydrogenase
MSFELSAEQEEFRTVVRDFAEKTIAPHAGQWDRDHHFPVDVVQQMGELGLFGLTAPEEFGGSNAGLTTPSKSSGASISRWASRSRPASGWGSGPS